MIRIILDKESQEYISKYFNAEINQIILHNNYCNYNHVCEMIVDLLNERNFSDLVKPWEYNSTNKNLIFFGINSVTDFFDKIKEEENTKI